MTTIAYKDGVMACDSAWVASDVYVSFASKIHYTSKGCLLGCAGEGDTRSVEKFFNRVSHPRQIPTRDRLDKFNTNGVGLLVFPNRQIWIIDLERASSSECSNAWPVEGFDYFAVGSGEKFARAAMACGQTAVEAVQIACIFDSMSKPPIHSIWFGMDQSDTPLSHHPV